MSQRMRDYWASAATYDRDEEHWPEKAEPCPLCGGKADSCPVCDGRLPVWSDCRSPEGMGDREWVQIGAARRRALAANIPGTCAACEPRGCPWRRMYPNAVKSCYMGPQHGPLSPATISVCTTPSGLSSVTEGLSALMARAVSRRFWDIVVPSFVQSRGDTVWEDRRDVNPPMEEGS